LPKRRTVVLKNVCVALVTVVLLFTACTKGGDEGETMGIKAQPELMVISISAMGPYQEAGVVFGQLFTYLGQNGIETTGPPMGIYYDDPEVVPPESLNYEIMAQVGKEIEVQEPFVYKVLPEMTVAYTVHRGTYDKLTETYSDLMKYIEDTGYEITGPSLEIYLAEHGETAEDEALTEIQFPVKKK
jgi:effector-binding domain-containing protein